MSNAINIGGFKTAVVDQIISILNKEDNIFYLKKEIKRLEKMLDHCSDEVVRCDICKRYRYSGDVIFCDGDCRSKYNVFCSISNCADEKLHPFKMTRCRVCNKFFCDFCISDKPGDFDHLCRDCNYDDENYKY